MSGRARWEVVALAIPVLVACAWIGVLVARDDGSRGSAEPVAVTATVERFTSVDGLVAASDLVVLAQVDSIGEGRAITDPADPTVGIRSRLVELRVERTLAGAAGATVVLEEEATLLDGTPIIVNGVAPSQVGDRGIYFLIAGDDPAAPYHALVNEQGRYLTDGQRVRPASTDALSRTLAARGLDGLIAAVAS